MIKGKQIVSQLEFNLYENAIDSIKHAIEHYTSDPTETRRYKYAILHLSQGVTLLLKERLSREHRHFIYKNVSNSEGVTVDVNMAIARLSSIAKVDLGDAKETVRELARLRNNIEHYDVSLPKQQADSVIGRVVPFLASFVRDELGREFQQEIGQQTWDELLRIQEYLVQAIKDAKQKITREKQRAFYCNRCQENTAMETEDGTSSCLVCLTELPFKRDCWSCGQVYFANSYPLAPYCPDCRNLARQKYSNFRAPGFVNEAKQLFVSLGGQATYLELLRLLSEFHVAGPSSAPSYIHELHQAGLIDFLDEVRKSEWLEVIDTPHHGGYWFQNDDVFIWHAEA